MRYEEVKGLKPEAFKRLTGVRPQVFAEIVAVLREAERNKKAGRTSKPCPDDKLWLAMSYRREYRTQFRIAASYGVHEPTANRIIHVEDVLIKSDKFSLPKRREVTETEWTVVLVDVTETPIERSKEATTLLQRKKAVPHAKESSTR